MLRKLLTRIVPLCILLLPYLPVSTTVTHSLGLPSAPTVVAQDDANADEAAAQAAKSESYLVWLYNALGLRYVIAFLFISFVFVAVLVMNILQARR